MSLANVPIRELIKKGLLLEAIKEREAKLRAIREENKNYIPVIRQGSAYIISDNLNDVVNPIDGKPYDSKSAYYRKVRESGCNIVEDNHLERKKVDRGDYDNSKELKEAIMQVTKGRGL